MPRHRPELKEWDDSWVRQVRIADPEAWVRAVLATPLVAAMQNPQLVNATLVPGGRVRPPKMSELPPFIGGMRFGEIREAIRRVLEDREAAGPEASRRPPYRVAKDASLRTGRGLRRLREKGALIQKGKRYRLSPEWGWKELTSRVFDLFIPGLAAGTINLENRSRQRDGRPYLEVELRRRRARSPEFYYGIRLA